MGISLWGLSNIVSADAELRGWSIGMLSCTRRFRIILYAKILFWSATQLVTSLLSAPIAPDGLRCSSSYWHLEGGQRHPGYHLPDIIKCDVDFGKDRYCNRMLSGGTTLFPVSVSVLRKSSQPGRPPRLKWRSRQILRYRAEGCVGEPDKAKAYELPYGNIIPVGPDRIRCLEVIFQPFGIGKEASDIRVTTFQTS
jgi:hypothetical protein